MSTALHSCLRELQGEVLSSGCWQPPRRQVSVYMSSPAHAHNSRSTNGHTHTCSLHTCTHTFPDRGGTQSQSPDQQEGNKSLKVTLFQIHWALVTITSTTVLKCAGTSVLCSLSWLKTSLVTVTEEVQSWILHKSNYRRAKGRGSSHQFLQGEGSPPQSMSYQIFFLLGYPQHTHIHTPLFSPNKLMQWFSCLTATH